MTVPHVPPLPPLILGALLLAGLLLLSSALGRRILRAFWAQEPERFGAADRLIIETCLGIGLLQFLPFTLLALGIGRPIGIKIAVASLVLVLLPNVLKVLREAPRAASRLAREFALAPAWQRILLVTLVSLLFVVFLRAICPITDDDGLSYHLTSALRMLEAGGFVYLPTLTYTNWPSATEALFLLLRGISADAPVGIVQFSFGLLTLAAIWRIGKSIGGLSLAWTGVVMMLVYKVFWEEMTQAHVDLGSALFATLAVFTLMSDPDQSNPQWRRLSALFAGLGATCKLNGIWIIAAMALAVAAIPAERAQPLSRRALRGASYFATGLCVVIPWLVRTWIVTGNPVYPIFFGLFGGREWTSEGWPRIQRYFLLMNTPPGLPPTLANLILGRITLVAVAALIALLAYRRTRRSAVAIPARYGFGFIPLLFLSSGYNMRFLLPAFPCVIFCAAYGLHHLLFPSGPNARFKHGPILVCMLAILLAVRIGGRGLEPGIGESFSVALGLTSSPDYLRARLPDYRTVEYANANLSSDARILVATWEESTAYYSRPALRSNYWLQDSVHYDSKSRLDADLARLAVTNVVYRPMDLGWCLRSSVCSGRLAAETRAIEDLLARRGNLLFTANGIGLYRLEPASGIRAR